MKWIENAYTKWFARASPVIVYETDDPKRIEQFYSFLNKLHNEGKVSGVYEFIGWKGLFKVNTETFDREPVTVGVSLMDEQKRPIRTLPEALNYMDSLMSKEKGIVFVLYNITERSGELVSALRAWNVDPKVYLNKHMIVVFTENAFVLFDDISLKYFIYERIPPSTAEEREKIIKEIASEFNIKRVSKSLVELTSGLNLHEVETAILESLATSGRLDAEKIKNVKYELIKKSGILDIQDPQYGFEGVGGYKVVKDFIIKNVINVFKNMDKARQMGLRPPRGILFFGPPGTGKTHFSKSLAKELNIPFLRFKTEAVLSKWYGESEQRISKMITIAESVAPAILFIDEIDRFGTRGQGEHEVTRRIFSTLLEWLGDENRKTIVVATTNRPQDLDPAFIRAGRFDYIIPILYPDFEARLQILEVHTSVLRKVPLDKNVNLRQIAEMTNLLSGAELEELVMRAIRNAFNEGRNKVTYEDFIMAIDSFRIDKERRIREQETYLELAMQFTNDVKFLNAMREVINVERVK